MGPYLNAATGRRRHLAAAGALAALLALAPAAALADPPKGVGGRSAEETVRLGKRMYRDGVLPNGAPMRAIVKGDIEVEGTAFSCQSCHMRAGIGSVEGEVYTPPTNARWLFRPRKKYYKGVEIKYNEPSELRGAYTDESLAILLGSGIDPSGRSVIDVMPYYLLDAEEMAILIAYLHTLSEEYSPGVTDTTLRFATVYSEDVPAADRDAMVGALEAFVAFKNGMREDFKRNATQRDRMMARAMVSSKMVEQRTVTLAQWVLRGPRETWRAQLEEYDRTQPAFALLGGLVTGDWRPIHEFSEEHEVPCVLPNTDYPVVSDRDWYTLYFTKGFYQEGEAAAHYLGRAPAAPTAPGAPAGPPRPRVLEIVRDSREARDLAAGFDATRRDLGHEPAITLALAPGAPLTPEALRTAAGGRPLEAIVLWDGPGALPALETIAKLDAGTPAPRIFASGHHLGDDLWKIPEQLRERVHLTWPFRPPHEKILNMMGEPIPDWLPPSRVARQSFALVEILGMAVSEIRDNYFRDYFLDVISMGMDQVVPLYERLSFGPGQRYASKGCYIVQLSAGPRPELVKKSPWVIH